jgi:membrane protease YdiL (CAAX protease family)
MEDTPPEPQFRWAPLDLAVFTVFFFFTVLFLPSVVLLLLRLFEPTIEVETLSGVQQIMIQALMDLVLVGFILFLITIRGGEALPSLRFFYKQRLPVLRLIAGGVALALFVVTVAQLFPAPTESPFEKLLTTPVSTIAFVFFGMLVAPFLEEIIFRGFVFTALADIEGPKLAIPLTAFLFALPHAPQLWRNWAALFLIFFAGYVFTTVRHRFGSVVPAIILHTAYNATIYGLSAIGSALGSGQAR